MAKTAMVELLQQEAHEYFRMMRDRRREWHLWYAAAAQLEGFYDEIEREQTAIRRWFEGIAGELGGKSQEQGERSQEGRLQLPTRVFTADVPPLNAEYNDMRTTVQRVLDETFAAVQSNRMSGGSGELFISKARELDEALKKFEEMSKAYWQNSAMAAQDIQEIGGLEWSQRVDRMHLDYLTNEVAWEECFNLYPLKPMRQMSQRYLNMAFTIEERTEAVGRRTLETGIEDRVRVRQGLAIREGSIIGVVIGRIYRVDDAALGTYSWQLTSQIAIDAAGTYTLGALINDTRDLIRLGTGEVVHKQSIRGRTSRGATPVKANAEVQRVSGSPFLKIKTLRRIEPGESIYVDYGREWWDGQRRRVRQEMRSSSRELRRREQPEEWTQDQLMVLARLSMEDWTKARMEHLIGRVTEDRILSHYHVSSWSNLVAHEEYYDTLLAVYADPMSGARDHDNPWRALIMAHTRLAQQRDDVITRMDPEAGVRRETRRQIKLIERMARRERGGAIGSEESSEDSRMQSDDESIDTPSEATLQSLTPTEQEWDLADQSIERSEASLKMKRKRSEKRYVEDDPRSSRHSRRYDEDDDEKRSRGRDAGELLMSSLQRTHLASSKTAHHDKDQRSSGRRSTRRHQEEDIDAGTEWDVRSRQTEESNQGSILFIEPASQTKGTRNSGIEERDHLTGSRIMDESNRESMLLIEPASQTKGTRNSGVDERGLPPFKEIYKLVEAEERFMIPTDFQPCIEGLGAPYVVTGTGNYRAVIKPVDRWAKGGLNNIIEYISRQKTTWADQNAPYTMVINMFYHGDTMLNRDSLELKQWKSYRQSQKLKPHDGNRWEDDIPALRALKERALLEVYCRRWCRLFYVEINHAELLQNIRDERLLNGDMLHIQALHTAICDIWTKIPEKHRQGDDLLSLMRNILMEAGSGGDREQRALGVRHIRDFDAELVQVKEAAVKRGLILDDTDATQRDLFLAETVERIHQIESRIHRKNIKGEKSKGHQSGKSSQRPHVKTRSAHLEEGSDDDREVIQVIPKKEIKKELVKATYKYGPGAISAKANQVSEYSSMNQSRRTCKHCGSTSHNTDYCEYINHSESEGVKGVFNPDKMIQRALAETDPVAWAEGIFARDWPNSFDNNFVIRGEVHKMREQVVKNQQEYIKHHIRRLMKEKKRG